MTTVTPCATLRRMQRSIRPRRLLGLPLALLVLVLNACAAKSAPLATAAGPILVTLQGKDLAVRVVAGAEHTLFDVVTHGGTPLAEALTKDQLRRLYPELRELVDQALAQGPLDASITPPPSDRTTDAGGPGSLHGHR